MSKKRSEQRNLSRRIDGVTMPIGRKRMKWGRNWLCLCGSGKKYKKCCLNEISDITASDGNAEVSELSKDIQELIHTHRKAIGKGGIKNCNSSARYHRRKNN